MCESSPDVYGRDGQPPTYQALECAQYCLSISSGPEAPPALDSMVTVSVSGARTLNGGHTAPVVVTEADGAAGEDLAAVRDLGGAGTPVYVASPDGSVRLTVSAD